MTPRDAARPLQGRRVVVTRAVEQAQPLVDRLVALGAEPIVVPLIETVDAADGGTALATALSVMDQYDWLAVTSPNGARRVAEAIAAAGTSRPRLAAVGTATEAALGVAADLVPAVQSADGLVDAFPDGEGRVLVAQAEGASPRLVAGLEAKGWCVDAVSAYRTTPISPSARTMDTVLGADAVLFASGSAVRSWAAVFGRRTPSLVVVIGPATAEVAADFGLKIDAVATDHSLDGLLESLLSFLGEFD